MSPKVRAGGHHKVSTPVKPRSVPVAQFPPTPPSSTSSQPEETVDVVESTKSTDSHTQKDSLKPEQEDPLHDISGFSSLDNSFSEDTNETSEIPSVKQNKPLETNEIETKLTSSDYELPPSVSQEDPPPPFDSIKDTSSLDSETDNMRQRVWSSIKTWWHGDERANKADDSVDVPSRQPVERIIKFDGCLRVCALPETDDHDIDPHQTPVMSPGSPSSSYVNLTSQPTNVYISQRDILRQCQPETRQRLPTSFLATLQKMDSPTEKSEKMKQSMTKRSERHGAIRKRGGADAKEILEEPVALTTLPTVVVRVIVLDCNHENTLTDHQDERTGVANLHTLSWLPDNHVLVHNLLRRQVGLEVSCRVRLAAFSAKPHEITQLSLHRLFQKVLNELQIV